MKGRRRGLELGFVLALACGACAAPAAPRRARFPFESLSAAMFSPPQVLAAAQPLGMVDQTNAIVLSLEEDSSFRAMSAAVEKLRRAQLPVGYWIDVTHTPRLARAHPDWTASDAEEYVPISSAQGFAAQLERIATLLRERPDSDAIFLSGLWGSTRACGCAQGLCALDADLDPAIAARFVAAVRGFAKGAEVLPVVFSNSPSLERECADPACAARDCAARNEQAWRAMRQTSPRLAVVLVKPAAETELAASIWASRELSACTRIGNRKPAGELNSTASPRLTAVLSAQDIVPAQLKATIATLSLGGARSLIAYDSKALATPATLRSAPASPSER